MKQVTIILLLLLLTLGASADQIEVIQLHNRSADDVIPLVRPMVRPGEAVSGTGYKLILRASPETVKEIRYMLAEIDKDLKNLVISVRHGDDIQSQQSEGGLRADYNSQRGGGISGYLSHDRIDGRSQLGQKVRVLEGGVAYVHTGTISSAPTIYHSHGGSTPSGTVRQSVGSGLYVAPQLRGNQVSLQISPYRERVTGYGNTVDTQNLRTVTSGQLGEWIYIGGAVQTEHLKQQGVLSSRRASANRQTGIYVKVDVVD